MLSPTRRSVSVTIPTAADGLSPAVDLADESLAGILVSPAGWTTGAITFQASANGVDYYNLYDSAGAEVSVASGSVVAGRMVAFAPALSDLFRGFRYIKLRSGTSATPVTQAAARPMECVIRQFA